jgi:predicted Zn-ribbon and HTH transcriptional regulator
VEILRLGPASITQLARELEMKPKDLLDDIEHIKRSLKHESGHLLVTPAVCNKCDFTFGEDKLRKPGKCPACRGTWISEPLLEIDG